MRSIAGHAAPLGPACSRSDFAFRKLRRNLDLNPSLAALVETHRCCLTDHDGAGVPAGDQSSHAV
jgi:hypothetical protein